MWGPLRRSQGQPVRVSGQGQWQQEVLLATQPPPGFSCLPSHVLLTSSRLHDMGKPGLNGSAQGHNQRQDLTLGVSDPEGHTLCTVSSSQSRWTWGIRLSLRAGGRGGETEYQHEVGLPSIPKKSQSFLITALEEKDPCPLSPLKILRPKEVKEPRQKTHSKELENEDGVQVQLGPKA